MKGLSSKLSHLSHSEQQEATLLLALIGLRFYTVHCGTDRVNLSKLRQLCGGVSGKSKSKSTEAVHLEDLRIGRLDAMVHFPFADDTGTISDILKQEHEAEVSPLLSMGKPGRKRFILKVFNEMRLDQSGIRLYNLPEALQRLGIRISSELSNYLLETRSVYNKDGSLRNYDEELHSFTKEVLVSLTQFEKIVCHCLLLLDSRGEGGGGDETHWLRDILSGGTNNINNNKRRGAAAGRREEREETRTDRSTEEEEEEEEGYFPREVFDEEEEDSLAEEEEEQRERGGGRDRGKRDKKKDEKRSRSSKGGVTDLTYSARLKQIPSKIGGVVRADRAAHRKAHSHTEKAALAALAKRRVDLITAMKGPPPSRGAAVLTSYPVGPSTRSSYNEEGEQQRRVRQQQAIREEARSRRRDRERLHDTDTGRAVGEIAEAFLSGSVGREINRGLLAPRTAVDLRVDQEEDEVDLHQISQYRHRTVGQKMDREREERESRQLYAPPSGGWKASRGGGGWVADFGPAHTHSQYTGAPARGEHYDSSSDGKPWHSSGQRSRGKSGKTAAQTSADNASSKRDLEEVISSISGNRKSSVEVEDTKVDENSSSFGVEDSFLVAMSKEIESMKREEEESFLRDKAEIMDHQGLNYTRMKSSSGKVVALPQYRKMDDDSDGVDSAVVGAGEGGHSYYTDSKVDYGAVYGSNFVFGQETEGTPRSKNLLKVLQSTVSLKEVAKK